MKNETTSTPKKTISVYLSLAEVEFVDAQAASVGLNRSDYVRSRLLFEEPVENTEKIDELTDNISLLVGHVDCLRSAVDVHLANVEKLETSEYLHKYWGIMVRLSCLEDELFEVRKQLLDYVSQIRRQLRKSR